MPPAISDDERSSPFSADDDVLPPKKPAPKKSAAKSKAKPAQEDAIDGEPMTDIKNGDAEAQDDEDEDNSDEYVVEKILSHAPGQGKTTLYEVKWMGYENPDDRTWEPEENLEGAMDILQAYWDSIGGKPQPKTPAKKGTKRKSTAATSQDTPEVSSSLTKRRGRKAPKTEEAAEEKTATLPEGSWEHHVQSVDAIEMSEEGEHKGNLMIYLLWNNGSRTQHTALQCRSRCPNKLLDYYESKLFVNLSKPKTRRRRSTNKA
ncbi:hypothetical protein D6C97_01186 [Aureobasidium pullulans]|nr:hypothetical protein D6C97_01186 [Aureobasidium pullulans]